MTQQTQMPTLTGMCPKCGADMRSSLRNGVVVDQCSDCRGVFLDHGELQRLIEAESGFYGVPPGRSADEPRVATTRSHAPSYGYADRNGWYKKGFDPLSHHGRGADRRRRRGGFLSELFAD